MYSLIVGAYNHWINSGCNEGRQVHTPFTIFPFFQERKTAKLVCAYFQANIGLENYARKREFCTSRFLAIKIINFYPMQASASFYAPSYISFYPDLQQAFGTNYLGTFPLPLPLPLSLSLSSSFLSHY
jgi:hypothetical protein